MRIVPLVVVENEIEEFELAAILRGDSPIEKGTEGIALH